jgi:hypothetical protein
MNAQTTTGSQRERKLGWRLVVRFALALLALFCCYQLIVSAAAAGVSRLLSTTAILRSNVGPAETAARLTPRDPEAHYTLALSLVNVERLSDAVVEFQQATRLRPHHYYEWLDLGVTLDRLGDQGAAIAALNESIRLAPSFAQPRWQLGNVFFRQARYQEAFAQLRLAAKSNPRFFASLMELAWMAADGDVKTAESLIQPETGRNHFEWASFLTKQGKGADAARQLIQAGEPQDDLDRLLLHRAIAALIEGNQFSDAYSVWIASHRAIVDKSSDSVGFLNGNFAEPIKQDDPGFGWQLPAVPSITVSIDPSGPKPNSRSLRFEFDGDSPLGTQPVYQLVLLQPKSRYSLSFMAKAEGLISGGPPVVLALAPGGKTIKILGQSEPLSPGTPEWSAYKIGFTTDENTSAVVIALQRLACNQNPCPVFGKLWLSDFMLSKA